MLLHVYRLGDAIGYYSGGVKYSKMIWDLDFSFLTPAYGDTRMWGTPMMKYISGFLITVIGPTMRGEFLLFSFLSLVGLCLIIRTYAGNYSNQGLKEYALLLLVWPSLVYWPSSVGKDALVLLGTGIVIYAYASRPGRIRWVTLLFGLALTSLIRPHVSGVLIVSIAAAHWLAGVRHWNVGRVVQGIMILLLGILLLYKGFSDLKIDADFEGIEEFVEERSFHSTQGGGAVETPGLGVSQFPLAIVNVLFRPFPWEAGTPTYAAAFLDMYAFWFLAIYRRRRVMELLKEWRSHQLLRMAIPFVLLYIMMLGVAVGNLGIIARQRIMVMPFLFLFLYAVPSKTAHQQPESGIQPRRKILGPVVLTTRKSVSFPRRPDR